jgi:hypothetical protein
VIDRLAGQRRPAAARQDCDAELAGDLDGRLDIVAVGGMTTPTGSTWYMEASVE